MSTLEKVVGSMLGLVFVYLLVANSSGATAVIQSLGNTSGNLFKTLQGR